MPRVAVLCRHTFEAQAPETLHEHHRLATAWVSLTGNSALPLKNAVAGMPVCYGTSGSACSSLCIEAPTACILTGLWQAAVGAVRLVVCDSFEGILSRLEARIDSCDCLAKAFS